MVPQAYALKRDVLEKRPPLYGRCDIDAGTKRWLALGELGTLDAA